MEEQLFEQNVMYGEASSFLLADWYMIEEREQIVVGRISQAVRSVTSRPFTFFAYDFEDLDWLIENAKEVKGHGVGLVVLFSGFYKNFQNPTGVGVFGTRWYEYQDEDLMTDKIVALKELGFQVLGYVFQPDALIWEGKPWRDMILDMYFHAKEYELDGYYEDGFYLGSHWETIAGLRALDQMGLINFLHQSVSMVDTNSMSWRNNPYGTMPNAHVWDYVDFCLMNEVPYHKVVDGQTYSHWPVTPEEWKRTKDYCGPTVQAWGGCMKYYLRDGEGDPPFSPDMFWQICVNYRLAMRATRRRWGEFKNLFFVHLPDNWQESDV